MLQQHHREIKRDTPHIRKSFERETELTRCWDRERSKAMAKKHVDDPESDDSTLKSDVLDCEFCGTSFSWKADLKKRMKEIFTSDLNVNYVMTFHALVNRLRLTSV